MKKNRLFVGFVSLVSLLALVGCSTDSGQSDAHRNELIHQFINAMKVSRSSYLAKGYKISFEQDYEVSYHSTSGESLIDYSLKRSSSGETSRFYEPSIGDSMEASGKRYNDGRGYFAGQQVESVDYLKKVTSKQTSESESTKSNYDFHHSFGVKYDSTHLFASGSSTLTNKLNASNSANKEFKGKVSKNVVGGYSDEYLDSVINNVLYLDAWDEIFDFIDYRQEYYQSNPFNTDEAIANLVKELSFEVSENNTTIEIGFKIDSSKAIKEIYGKDVYNAGSISGKIITDKQTGRIASYEYDLKDYLGALLSYSNRIKEQYSYNVTSFNIKGMNLNTSFDSLVLNGPFNEYGEDNAQEFSSSFNDVIVPHIEDVLVVE